MGGGVESVGATADAAVSDAALTGIDTIGLSSNKARLKGAISRVFILSSLDACNEPQRLRQMRSSQGL
jgi:hypothetical protein